MNARTSPLTRYVAAFAAAVVFAAVAALPSPHPASAAVQVQFLNPSPGRAAAAPMAKAVVLPQITVRPTAAERAEAFAHPLVADSASPFVKLGDSRAGGGGYVTSPRMNFDMPYYSFGKRLPRAASRD